MQVAADPAAVVLAAEHEPLAAGLQLGGEQAGADRHRCLAHEVDQQALVAPRQHRAVALDGQHQPADALVLVGDVDLLHLRRRGAVRGREQAAVGGEHLDPHVADLEGVGHRGGEGRQLLVDRPDGLEPGRQRGHRAVAVVAAAQQQAVDEPAEPAAERAVDDDGQHEHDEGDVALVEPVAEQRGAGSEHGEVDADDDRGDDGGGQGPRDQGVDVAEARAHAARRRPTPRG